MDKFLRITTADTEQFAASGSERSSYSLKECPAYGNSQKDGANSGSERSSYIMKACAAYGNKGRCLINTELTPGGETSSGSHNQNTSLDTSLEEDS